MVTDRDTERERRPVFHDLIDPFHDPDLDSLEPIVESWVTRDTDPEGILHGVGLAATVTPMAAALWADHVALQAAGPVWACDWLVEAGIDEDGERIVRECGAPTRYTDEDAGAFACQAGHRHAGIEAELAPWGLEWQREQIERAA
jgi:hypothetical protein